MNGKKIYSNLLIHLTRILKLNRTSFGVGGVATWENDPNLILPGKRGREMNQLKGTSKSLLKKEFIFEKSALT